MWRVWFRMGYLSKFLLFLENYLMALWIGERYTHILNQDFQVGAQSLNVKWGLLNVFHTISTYTIENSIPQVANQYNLQTGHGNHFKCALSRVPGDAFDTSNYKSILL